MKLRVLVLGYGEMGHALEFLLSGKHDVMIWSRGSATRLEDEAARAQVILFCLPVNAHTDIAQRIAPHVSRDSLCLSIAKGLDEAGMPAFAILSNFLDGRSRYGVVYGPMISEEIRRDRYAFADVALSDAQAAGLITQLFGGSKLLCRPSRDMPGISWSVILKNVYAILFGIADGLQLGDNVRGHLAVAALTELAAIAQVKGGVHNTPYGYAGLGDLITTATSVDSHHHELGRNIARGDSANLQGEGVHTVQMVEKFGLFNTEDYPLFRLAVAILRKPENLPELMKGYMQSLTNGK